MATTLEDKLLRICMRSKSRGGCSPVRDGDVLEEFRGVLVMQMVAKEMVLN